MKYVFWSGIFTLVVGLLVDWHGLGWLFVYEAGVLFIIAGIIAIAKECGLIGKDQNIVTDQQYLEA